MESKTKIILTILATFLLVGVYPVSAVTSDDSSDSTVEETTTGTTMEKRVMNGETRLEDAKKRREERQEEIKTRREEAKAEMEQKREEFQERLEALKDEKKATIVERVDTRLSEKNQSITERLLGHLDRISTILDTLEGKLADAKGTDDTDVTEAIDTAREMIQTAEDKVVEQAGREYVIELAGENTLKEVVSATVTEFRSDIGVVIASVKEARDATIDVAKALAQYREGDSSMMKEESASSESSMMP